MPIVRESPDMSKFSVKIRLPLRREDFACRMSFFFDVNSQLHAKGIRHFDDMLRPAAMSGLISDMMTASMARHAHALVENRNGHPDLIVDGVYADNSVKAGEQGVEVKSTRKTGGAVDAHGARAQFVYRVNNETDPAMDRAPVKLTEIYLGRTAGRTFAGTSEANWAPAQLRSTGKASESSATAGCAPGRFEHRYRPFRQFRISLGQLDADAPVTDMVGGGDYTTPSSCRQSSLSSSSYGSAGCLPAKLSTGALP